MNRFVGFSTRKSTDELYRPSEKKLRDEFFSIENVKIVYQTVQTNVSTQVSYNMTMETMKTVFRLAIGTDDHPSISEMNIETINRVKIEFERAQIIQDRHTERAFTNANVPTRILPRPSMALPRNDDDEARGKYTIELLR